MNDVSYQFILFVLYSFIVKHYFMIIKLEIFYRNVYLNYYQKSSDGSNLKARSKFLDYRLSLEFKWKNILLGLICSFCLFPLEKQWPRKCKIIMVVFCIMLKTLSARGAHYKAVVFSNFLGAFSCSKLLQRASFIFMNYVFLKKKMNLKNYDINWNFFNLMRM